LDFDGVLDFGGPGFSPALTRLLMMGFSP